MKRLLSFAVLTVLLAGGQAVANPILCGGSITAQGIIAQGPSSCGIYDDQAGIVHVYILHYPGQDGARAARFIAPTPDCFVAIHSGDDINPIYTVTGDFENGIEVDYGACIDEPILVADRTYATQGLTEECCFYFTEPHPDCITGEMEELTCAFQWEPVGSLGAAQINPSGNWCTSPVEPSTWGRVKALYDR